MSDDAAITDIAATFFSAFASGPDAATRIDALRTILLPEAIIVNASGERPVLDTVESFIAPRVELLSSGRLESFEEWMESARIDIFGDIAQVWCTYAKSWVRDGIPECGRGTKTIQLVRTGEGWRISSVAWDDEAVEVGASPESVGPAS